MSSARWKHRPGHVLTSAVSFANVEVKGVVGHRQVTDPYLAQLARKNKGQLAVLDAGSRWFMPTLRSHPDAGLS